LRAGRLSEADIEHVAAEIESLGRSEKRELVSRLTILLLHLFKWQVRPARRGPSWHHSIANARDDITDHLADNPSLGGQLDAAVIAAYRRAHRDAAGATGLGKSAFPPTCPWSFEQMMAEDFWPGEA
jgi:hypothetical protein